MLSQNKRLRFKMQFFGQTTFAVTFDKYSFPVFLDRRAAAIVVLSRIQCCWSRSFQALIPPAYVEPFVKRHKNDAIDAEAICEAAQRSGMRFVAVKSEEQQAAVLVFRTCDLVVRQRTQFVNAVRGHLAEYGWVTPRGTAHMTMLADLLEDEEMTSTLREAARPMFKLWSIPWANSASRSPRSTARSRGGRRGHSPRHFNAPQFPLAQTLALGAHLPHWQEPALAASRRANVVEFGSRGCASLASARAHGHGLAGRAAPRSAVQRHRSPDPT